MFCCLFVDGGVVGVVSVGVFVFGGGRLFEGGRVLLSRCAEVLALEATQPPPPLLCHTPHKAPHLRDQVELVDVVLPREQRPPPQQLRQYAADGPHVDRGRVVAARQQQLGRAVPARHHVLGQRVRALPRRAGRGAGLFFGGGERCLRVGVVCG